MKKQKGSILQRMMAVLLTAVLVVGMTSNAVPNTVLAQEDAASSVSDGRQESTEGNTEEPAEGNTKPEEKAPAPVETTNPEEPKQETPVPEEEPKQETPAPEEEPKQETPKPDGETAEQGTVSGNDAAPEMTAAPQSVMMAAEPSPQADNIASGNGWVLDADGKLTISSDEGMGDWQINGLSAYKSDVTSAEIQSGVKCIYHNTFWQCGNLTNITIPASVTNIKDSAFEACSSLTSITIPENVSGIGNFAFKYCGRLTEVKMEGETPPSVGTDVFYGCKFVTDNTQGIHVPAGKAQAYKTAWTEWADYIAEDSASAEEHKHNDVTFTPWTKTDSLPNAAGNYYLTDNVTLSTWYTPNGETTLCLNGKTISVSGTDSVIQIGMNQRLNLYDCRDAGKITGGKSSGVCVRNGSFYMYGGEISGNQASNNGGGVVMQSGTFYMYGGKISGNQASGNGGGVDIVAGTFHMYGGEISGNQASNNGGGVFHETVNSLSTVGGSAVISGNTSNGTENNVYLSYGLIELDSSNPLSEPAKIGVTTATAPTEGNPVNITGHNKGDYSSYFTSDNPAYEIVNTDDVVQLVVKSETPSESGTVTPEVKPGENAPETNISTPAEDLREMLLTDDEKQQVQNGTDVKIVLEVKDAGSTVSDSDKAAIQQALNGFTVGQYLHIDLYKLVGADPDHKVITETAKKIKIVITVPDSLKNTDSSKTRTFAVIRVHSGNAELLNDLDNSADTITIETDRFSTYAIVYKDTANGGSGDDDNGGGSGDGDGGGNSGGGDNGSDSGNNGGDNGNGSNGGSADQNGGNNNGSGSNNGAGSNNGGKNSSQNSSAKITTGQGSAKDDEPKTGDNTPLELSATLAMIAGFAYLLLYFADRERGMTEETKKELVSRLVGWARQGGRIRRYLALVAIFVLLVYYHSIGKKTCTEWKAIYGE